MTITLRWTYSLLRRPPQGTPKIIGEDVRRQNKMDSCISLGLKELLLPIIKTYQTKPNQVPVI